MITAVETPLFVPRESKFRAVSKYEHVFRVHELLAVLKEPHLSTPFGCPKTPERARVHIHKHSSIIAAGTLHYILLSYRTCVPEQGKRAF